MALSVITLSIDMHAQMRYLLVSVPGNSALEPTAKEGKLLCPAQHITRCNSAIQPPIL